MFGLQAPDTNTQQLNKHSLASQSLWPPTSNTHSAVPQHCLFNNITLHAAKQAEAESALLSTAKNPKIRMNRDGYLNGFNMCSQGPARKDTYSVSKKQTWKISHRSDRSSWQERGVLRGNLWYFAQFLLGIWIKISKRCKLLEQVIVWGVISQDNNNMVKPGHRINHDPP